MAKKWNPSVKDEKVSVEEPNPNSPAYWRSTIRTVWPVIRWLIDYCVRAIERWLAREDTDGTDPRVDG